PYFTPKSKISQISTTYPKMSPTFRKTTQNFDHHREKQPYFPKNRRKITPSMKNSHILQHQQKQKRIIFARKNSNT
ncbi:MAG: hypothetical protein IIX78_01930, partial [Alistipes sp.]|nr:hypothetical protein [Alistipes sp.]